MGKYMSEWKTDGPEIFSKKDFVFLVLRALSYISFWVVGVVVLACCIVRCEV